MEDILYKAFVVDETSHNVFKAEIKENAINDLPDGDVIVRVNYSSLNYKDALSAKGNKAVTRKYPHTPGIDASGIITESKGDDLKAGDEVVVMGYDLGMNTSGGYGQYIRVPSKWVVKLPTGITLKECMIFGTAGFTAAMSVHKLIETVKPEHGEILVTGASGGVGSVAVGILSKLGYSVIAVSGKAGAKVYLEKLGAKGVIKRNDFSEKCSWSLLKARWAGVIDTVGGVILENAIKSTKPRGIVTCCGNVASPELRVSVYPFILRGVTLAGIDSQNCPLTLRRQIWAKLANEWKFNMLTDIYNEISLHELNDAIERILKGQLQGRTVISLDL